MLQYLYVCMYLYECLCERSRCVGWLGCAAQKGLAGLGQGLGARSSGVPAATNWQLRRCYSAQTVLLGPAWHC